MRIRIKPRLATWKSARALLILSSVVAVSSWAGEKPSSDGPASTLTSAIQIRRLSTAEAARAKPVHLSGVVTYADLKGKMLFVQDSTCGVYINASDLTQQLQPGEQVEVDGFLGPGSYNPIISRARVTVTGVKELPKSSLRSVRTLASGDDDCNWVEVTGTVGSTTVEGGHLILNINEAGDWIKARIRISPEDEFRDFVNAKVRIQGVCVTSANQQRQLIRVQLFAPSLAFMTIEEPPPKDVFTLPIRSIGEILNPVKTASQSEQVHVQGVVQANTGGNLVLIQDPTGGIHIESSRTNDLNPGLWVDVVGSRSEVRGARGQGSGEPDTAHLTPGSLYLTDVTFRRIGNGDTNQIARTNAPESSAKILTTVQQVRALKPAEAALGQSVRVRGVVTYYVPGGWGTLFVQDATAGIYVNAGGQTLDLELGQWIDLEGVTAPGDFVPIITSPRVQLLGRAPLPMARRFTAKELFSGNKDSQWLRVDGIVQSVEMRDAQLIMDVADGGTHFEVMIPDFLNKPLPTHLVDAKVHINGVCATMFNQKRQLVGVRLLVPSLEFITSETSAPDDPFALPVRAINSLSQFAVTEETDHRVRVQGTVTFCRPKEFFFVQDESAGLLIKTEQAGTLVVGDRMDVVGFEEAGNYTPALTRAIFRRSEGGNLPAALEVTAEQALSANFQEEIFDAKLVSLQCHLLELAVQSKEKTLVMQQGGTVFNAHFTGDALDQFCSSLRIGSLLKITGVCSVQVDAGRSPKSFQIYLRSPKDITILKSAPFWTARHILWLFAVMFTIALLSVGWIVALRRRVRAQTELIQQRLEREKALEVRYRELFDGNPHPMWVCDLETLGFVAINDAAVHHYGYSRAEFLRMTLKDIRPAREVDVLLKSLNATRDQKIVKGIREVHRKHNGDVLQVEISSHQLVFAGRKASLVLATDITERLKAEDELDQAHKQLLEASRRGGMAEIATNVLHNVGNVLNSVNISTSLIVESVKKSRVSSLDRVAALLREHTQDLATFITTDPRGKHLPAHLAQLSEHLLADQGAMLSELDSLRRNVEHIKEIVAMQQSYATFGGVKEMVNVVYLVEDSLRMNEGALSRHRVAVIREFAKVPPLNVEKHKILQILVNLVRNAKNACDDSARADKRLTVGVANGAGRVKISVIDNGVGIPPENLARIFNHGFTTRKNGHGFGLHSGALAANEMGGSLTVQSDGPGQGATFTLELPCNSPNRESISATNATANI